MQLIEKREKEMDKQEKLMLEIMRTIAAGKCKFSSERGNRISLRDENIDFNFTKKSSAFYMADSLIKRFDIEFKDKSEEKVFWNEKELMWNGKDESIIDDKKEEAKVEEKKEEVIERKQKRQVKKEENLDTFDLEEKSENEK